MKTRIWNKNKISIIVNSIIIAFLTLIVIQGFGSIVTITNLTATTSISLFEYAFLTLNPYQAALLQYNIVYIIGFILLIIAIGMSTTNLVLSCLNKRKIKIERGFYISIICILFYAILSVLLSKVIYLNDLKQGLEMSQELFKKYWTNSQIGIGSICIAIFGCFLTAIVSIMLYRNIKKK